MSSIQASTKRSLAAASRLVRRRSARMAASRSSIKPSHSSRLRSVALVLFGQLPIGGRHSGKTEDLHLLESWVGQHYDLPLLH